MRHLIYKAIMRAAHRLNWHYAPTIGPLEDGHYQQWCKWCGMRYTKPIEIKPLH